jgi:Fe-S cluster assembly protein SufD
MELLTKQRDEAHKQFTQLPMPNFRYGLTTRMDISDLEMGKFNFTQTEPLQLPKHDGIIIDTIQNIIKSQPELIQPHFMQLFNNKNKLTAMHAAFWKEGMVIIVPKNTQSKQINITRHLTKNTSIHNNLIIAEEGSSATITEHITSTKQDQALYSSVTEIIAKQNCHIKFTTIQNYAANTFSFNQNHAKLANNASIEWTELTLGSTFTQSENNTILLGSGSSAKTTSLFFGDKEQRFDLSASTHHIAPNTQSMITARGILNNKAKNIFRGLIKIDKNATNSNGYQKQDTLSLSPEAEADNIPTLEIDNNDVKCGHAATIGQIDPEKLFYLISRGLTEQAARNVIVHGFFEPILAALHTRQAEEVRSHIEQRLPC